MFRVMFLTDIKGGHLEIQTFSCARKKGLHPLASLMEASLMAMHMAGAPGIPLIITLY